MRIRIPITGAELDYLQGKKEFVERFGESIKFLTGDRRVLELSEDEAIDLNEFCSDWLQIEGFDLEYKLTPVGQICEALIDKLYVP